MFSGDSPSLGFPGGSDGKESDHNAGDLDSIPGLGRSPGEGNGNLLHYSCLEYPKNREAPGYSPWGRKELDTTSLSRWSDSKESTCNAGDLGLIPGLGRSLGGGNGNPLQSSCLENSKDRGGSWAIAHRVAESDMTEAT